MAKCGFGYLPNFLSSRQNGLLQLEGDTGKDLIPREKNISFLKSTRCYDSGTYFRKWLTSVSNKRKLLVKNTVLMLNQ